MGRARRRWSGHALGSDTQRSRRPRLPDPLTQPCQRWHARFLAVYLLIHESGRYAIAALANAADSHPPFLLNHAHCAYIHAL